jgi:hypothetical protein
MNKNPQIEETIEQLTELVETQDRALKTADAIISLKNILIEICEMETDLYRKQNLRLRTSLMICTILLMVSAILSLLRLTL